MEPNLHILHSVAPPHGGQPVLVQGAVTPPTHALILVHGRGGTAAQMFQLAHGVPATTLVIAPQAAYGTWYPERFLVPQLDNEPSLSAAIDALFASVLFAREQGVADEHIVLAGFSQGACLVAEFLKRYPKRYGGAAIMSGGLIGTDEEVQVDLAGSFAETAMYLGCDEKDFHIPFARVEATAAYFTQHGANVSCHRYHGIGHSIHPDAIAFIERQVQNI